MFETLKDQNSYNTKIELSFEDYKAVCYQMTKKIKALNTKFIEVVAVSRGGMTPAYLIGKELRLDIGVYSPKARKLFTVNSLSKNDTILVIDDLVALGRTYKALKEDITLCNFIFCPFLVDGYYFEKYPKEFPVYGMVSKEWVVFPYEDPSKVTVGTKGFRRYFRDQV
jgi:hypoxanthine phosphoribosyltransferase